MEKELIHNIKTDRENTFRQLVKEYKEKVYWHVRKILLDHEDSNDVTQEVFVKVWKNLDSFKGDSSFSTWILRIAFNTSFTFLSKKKKLNEEPLNEAIIEGHNRLEIDDPIVILLKALKELPEKQRLVFSLKYFDDLKYDEMAELLETSEGALKASYHHAVKKIKKIIMGIKPLDKP